MKLHHFCIFSFVILGLIFLIGGCNKPSTDSPTEPTVTTGAITGNITSLQGSPQQTYGVQGAIISTQPPTNSAQITYSGSSYTISDVPVGTYMITASKNNYSVGTSTITVSAGQTSHADVSMTLQNCVVTVVLPSSYFDHVQGGISIYVDDVLLSVAARGDSPPTKLLPVGNHKFYLIGIGSPGWTNLVAGPTTVFIDSESWSWIGT